MIYLEPEYLIILRNILHKYVPANEVRIFGSRVRGDLKPFSDIDLVIMNDVPLSLRVSADLKEAFAESDLPYKVDFVEWCLLSPSFQQLIDARWERLI